MRTKTLLQDLSRSHEYRAEFVASHAKLSLPLQIRELLKQEQLTQTELAKRAELPQSTVSRAADPEYGNLTINTLVRIAAGFDVAFVCGFVPFGHFLKWIHDMSVERRIPTFREEYADVTTDDGAADTATAEEWAATVHAMLEHQQRAQFQTRAQRGQLKFDFMPQPSGIVVSLPVPPRTQNDQDKMYERQTDPASQRQRYAPAA